MNKKHHKIPSTLFAIVLMTGVGVSVTQAESKDEEAKEIALFNQAKISLSDAIKAAEQKTGGKALEADLDDESATVQFEIETLKGNLVQKVIVDGKTGAVLKVSLDDESDENAEHEKENEKE